MKLNIVVRFDLKQKVNQWICIALISSMTFVVVLYYMTNKATSIGNSFAVKEAFLLE